MLVVPGMLMDDGTKSTTGMDLAVLAVDMAEPRVQKTLQWGLTFSISVSKRAPRSDYGVGAGGQTKKRASLTTLPRAQRRSSQSSQQTPEVCLLEEEVCKAKEGDRYQPCSFNGSSTP